MKVGDIVSIGERNGMIVRDCSVCEENDPNCEAYGKFVVADAQHQEMLFVTEDEMDLVSACPFDVNTETVLSILNPANGGNLENALSSMLMAQLLEGDE